MQIAGVLQLTNRTLYGMTSRKVPMYLFTPLNRDFPEMAVASTAKDKSKNVLAIVSRVVSSEKNTGMTRGALVSIIGQCGDMAAERQAIHYAYSPLRWNTFPIITEPTGADHEPIHDVPTINIDPPGCKDIDDCISIWPPAADGSVRFAVTIADVAEWLRFNPWMDQAGSIGQTLYDPDGRVINSMFPHEQRMSLVPKARRLGVALVFTRVGDTIRSLHFQQVSIVNKASYTYDNVHAATDFPVATLRSLCELIAKRPLPDAHEWVETLMTTYNLKLAEHLRASGSPYGLLRSHSGPSLEKSKLYDELGLPDHLAMEAARYEPVSSGATHHVFRAVYCHATSPIRRWADIVNQMALKKMPDPGVCYAEICTRLQTYPKKHARDLQCLDLIASGNSSANGVVVSPSRIWVPDWKRLVTCHTEFPAGKDVSVDYFVDLSRPTWKQRLVFRAQTLFGE